jgi:RNA polymerase sigma factor (sigma-70 family)
MDYQVSIRVKNARLLNKIESLGFSTIKDFCDDSGFSYQAIIKEANLKSSVYDKKFNLRKIPSMLADHFKCDVLELYPEEVWYEALKETKAEIQLTSDELQQAFPTIGADSLAQLEDLMEVDSILSRVDLPPRRKELLEMRYKEGLTLKECGEVFGVTQERVRQIEIGAIRKVRRQVCKDFF